MPLIGVGPGNYSSRSAWIVSGEYLQQQPSFIPVTPTPVAKEFNFSIWTKGLISDAFKGGGSITNQPFSSWFSVLAEMGLLGLLFFGWIFYTLSGAFNYVSKTSTDPFMQNLAMGLKMSLVYILLLFFVDNVFEWPLVMGQFFIFACALIRITEKEMHVAADHTISNTITGESIR